MQIRNYRKDFYDTFIKKVFPILINMEDERKQYLRDFKLMPLYCILAEIITIIVSCLVFVGFKIIPEDSIYTIGEVLTACIFTILNAGIVICSLAIILLPVFFWILRSSIPKNFKSKVKEKCLTPLLEVFGDFHKSDNFPDKELLQNSKLFELGKIKSLNCDDNFTGTHKGVKFHISEVQICQYGSDEEYKGVIINFSSNKRIKAQTTIINRSSAQSKGSNNRRESLYIIAILTLILALTTTSILSLGHGRQNIPMLIFVIIQIAVFLFILIRKINKKINYTNLKIKPEEINLEDASFNKCYEIVSENQIEARYLITPAFIERYKNLQTAFQSNEINCSFFENKIVFAIKTDNDAFELVDDLNTPLSKTTRIQKFLEEIICIYEMIDHFKLNEKTGL